MKFKELISNLGNKGNERKAKIKELDEDLRIQKLVEDRQKSANERELERYMKEDREKAIKHKLNYMRKKRDKEYNLGNNPLYVKNIVKSNCSLLKQKNLFR